MNKTMKRVLSVVCAIALVVSSMTGLCLVTVVADTTSTVISSSDEARTALVEEVASEDYNFALGKNASVSSLTGGNNGGTDVTVLTDGILATGRSATTTVTIGQKVSEDKWAQVDLGNAYKSDAIDRVAVEYYSKNTSAQTGYSVQYSYDGLNFVEIATVGANTTLSGNYFVFLDEIEMTDEQKEEIPYVRFVRVVAVNDANNTNNGLQVLELAVLTDGTTKVSEVEYKEVEKLDEVASLTVTSSTYGQLEFSFEASPEDDGYTYYAYIDGKQYAETVIPGETYTVENLSGGEHRVKIVAYKDSLSSDGITEVVSVTDTKSLLTDERNIATGKIASASSIRENDKESAVTDGVLNVLFRTSTTENTANVVIDLGQNYRLDAIERTVSLFADNRYPKAYTVDFSLNGVVYETVATATGDSALQTTTVDVSECTLEAVRYVRFSFASAVEAGYGFQMYELGVIAKEGADLTPVEVEKVVLEEPASLTVTSSDYCQLEYTFEAAENHDEYEYYAFVNGAKVDEPVIPGETYIVTGLTAGEHTVRVVSYYDGNISDGIEGTVEVKDYASLFGSERNIAVGKSVTATSIRDEATDIPANITDGNLTNLFRTATTDATASVTIDLGDVYKAGAIERVVVMFVDYRYAQDYIVECSLDGETYEQIGSVTGITQSVATAKCDATQIEMTTAQYIRITFSNAVSAYGFQVNEIAVIEEFTPITEAEISMDETEYYTGEAIEPEITLTYKEKTLVNGKDYELVITDNTAVGTAKVTINGLGRYTGSVDKTFEIVKQDMANVAVYYGFDEENELVVDLVNVNTDMVVNVDYTYIVGTDADGNITITATGMGDNYTGEVVEYIMLEDVPVNEAANVDVSSPDLNTIAVEFENADKLGAASQTYNIYIDDELVDEAVVAGSYSYDLQTVGTHTVKVVADLVGKKSEGVSADVEVAGMDISSENAEITIAEIAPEYTGSEVTMDEYITVKYNGNVLVLNENYIIEYSDNINAGTAKYVVTGIGLYEGSVDGTFPIAAKSIDAESLKVEVTFNDNKEIVVTVGDGETTLVEGVDYECTAITDAEYNVTVTVKGLNGNYSGEIITTVSGDKNPNKPAPTTQAPTTQAPTTQVPTTVSPTTNSQGGASTDVKVAKVKKVKVKKLNAKKAKVTWKKLASAKGYEIRYSTSKKLKKATTKKLAKNKTSYIIKKLNKKKYYVQVRAYVVVDGNKVYGKWSIAKKVKMK